MITSTPPLLSGGIKGPEPGGPAESAAPVKNRRSFSAQLVPESLKRVEAGPDPAEASEGRKKNTQELAEKLKEAAERSNAYFTRSETQLQFEIGDRTGRTVIRVVDKSSGEVVREIPPEELVRISERIDELKGLLFNAQG